MNAEDIAQIPTEKLIDFMIEKANTAKQSQFDVAKFQTEDYEATS